MFTTREDSSTTKQHPLSNASNKNSNKISTNLKAQNFKSKIIPSISNNIYNSKSENINGNDNNKINNNVFYSLTPISKDLKLIEKNKEINIINEKNISKSPRDLEEFRTDNEEDDIFNEKQENKSFLINSIRKQKKFFSKKQKINKSQKVVEEFTKKQKTNVPRLVSKDGECLISPIHVPNECCNVYR